MDFYLTLTWNIHLGLFSRIYILYYSFLICSFQFQIIFLIFASQMNDQTSHRMYPKWMFNVQLNNNIYYFGRFFKRRPESQNMEFWIIDINFYENVSILILDINWILFCVCTDFPTNKVVFRNSFFSTLLTIQ